MKAKKFVLASMLVVLMGLVGGCHYGDNDHPAWGYGGSSYREGFRDGRTYQRRRDTTWGYTPYYERYGYYRR